MADCTGILLIEPFYGGSHKQLTDVISSHMDGCSVHTMTAKKWHWRSRTSAIHFAQTIPQEHSFNTLFCSSVLPLSDLVAIRPDLSRLRKIVYFHENQLIYPVRKKQDGDFQYGYSQVLSCLAADVVVFNSSFNMESFLGNIHSHLNLIPDYRPKDIDKLIRVKSRVLYFPIEFPKRLEVAAKKSKVDQTEPLHIIWPHRWEHDKGPKEFFECLFKLTEDGTQFKVSVIGEQFSEIPEIFETGKEKLGDRIVHWGYLPTKEEYYKVLTEADVVVSTAKHEFFGVAMLEAAYFGCYPLCPNRLSYPEIFPKECLYNTPAQLVKTLKRFCKFPEMVRKRSITVNFEQYSWASLCKDYQQLLNLHENALSK